jgi:hypothetical protein
MVDRLLYRSSSGFLSRDLVQPLEAVRTAVSAEVLVCIDVMQREIRAADPSAQGVTS